MLGGLMPTDINMRLDFLSTSGEPLSFTDCVTRDPDSSAEGKENLAREMFAELRKAISFVGHMEALPSTDDLTHSISFTKRPSDPMAFIDLFNVPALWLEIGNTFTDLRYVLAQAKAYKELEPPDTTPLSDSLCAYLHFEKMYRLNLAVFQLVKMQDLVLRLLQETFSGKLISVDYDDDDWERDLRLRDIKTGLKTLADNGKLSDLDYQAILAALACPAKSSHRQTVVRYRNRLAHGIRPSVDYPELYTNIEDRRGEVIRDASGIEKGRTYGIRGGSIEPEFLFGELYTALADYMGRVAEMLKGLKLVPRLS
jgi:hypothetical protein